MLFYLVISMRSQQFHLSFFNYLHRYLKSLLTDIRMIEEFQPRDESTRKTIDEVCIYCQDHQQQYSYHDICQYHQYYHPDDFVC